VSSPLGSTTAGKQAPALLTLTLPGRIDLMMLLLTAAQAWEPDVTFTAPCPLAQFTPEKPVTDTLHVGVVPEHVQLSGQLRVSSTLVKYSDFSGYPAGQVTSPSLE
jgi:hypothetical protein